jgi:hypothetical protein
MYPQGNNLIGGSMFTSTTAISGYNHPGTTMPSTYIAYHNLITNGGIATLPYSCLFSGQGTFIDANAVYGDFGVESYTEITACLNYWFYDLGRPLEQVFSPSIWTTTRAATSNSNDVGAYLRQIDLDQNRAQSIDLNACAVVKPWASIVAPSPTRKYPYMCGEDGRLLRDGNDGNVVVSYVIGPLFDSEQGQAVGDDIATALSLILPRLNPDPYQPLGPDWPAGIPSGCTIETPLTFV